MQESRIYLCLFMHIIMATPLYNNNTDPIIIPDNLLFYHIVLSSSSSSSSSSYLRPRDLPKGMGTC
jgi:hypothetical protein